MQPDDLRARDTEDWLSRSLENLRNAEHDLTARPPFVRDALFHAQQSVEMALKGLLTWHDQPFAKIHNLEELASLAALPAPGLGALAGRAAPLNKYAVRFRYPGEPYAPSVEEAQEAIALARALVSEIAACLPN
ncbi:MAG: HEPN domain-containing protein [Bryobacteraceae bacterium]|jgi:HEPN domain-containing protein